MLAIGIEKVLEELQRQNQEQKELLNALSESESFVYSDIKPILSYYSRLACRLC